MVAVIGRVMGGDVSIPQQFIDRRLCACLRVDAFDDHRAGQARAGRSVGKGFAGEAAGDHNRIGRHAAHKNLAGGAVDDFAGRADEYAHRQDDAAFDVNAFDDFAAVKRITRPMMGFKSFWSAKALIAGIETMHMVRKGQLDGLKDGASSPAQQFYSLALCPVAELGSPPPQRVTATEPVPLPLRPPRPSHQPRWDAELMREAA